MRLEEKLREMWGKYNSTCHVEDRMDFIDYAYQAGVIEGHKVIVHSDGWSPYGVEIEFKKIEDEK